MVKRAVKPRALPKGVDDEKKLLYALKTAGGASGNRALMRELKWKEDHYFRIRNRLVDQGLVDVGRGRGGSTKLVAPGIPVVRKKQRVEHSLYPEIRQSLNDTWVPSIKGWSFDRSWIETLAMQGARETGGKWSRPDFALIGITNYAYVPGKVLDVVTFEVKVADAIDVSVVYEALAHRRSATRSYVILSVPEDEADTFEDVLATVRDEARRHGIGVIEFFDASDPDTWEETVEGVRVDADPQRINEFIRVQISGDVKEQILKEAR